jgi:hypothetical protein
LFDQQKMVLTAVMCERQKLLLASAKCIIWTTSLTFDMERNTHILHPTIISMEADGGSAKKKMCPRGRG